MSVERDIREVQRPAEQVAVPVPTPAMGVEQIVPVGGTPEAAINPAVTQEPIIPESLDFGLLSRYGANIPMLLDIVGHEHPVIQANQRVTTTITMANGLYEGRSLVAVFGFESEAHLLDKQGHPTEPLRKVSKAWNEYRIAVNHGRPGEIRMAKHNLDVAMDRLGVASFSLTEQLPDKTAEKAAYAQAAKEATSSFPDEETLAKGAGIVLGAVAGFKLLDYLTKRWLTKKTKKTIAGLAALLTLSSSCVPGNPQIVLEAEAKAEAPKPGESMGGTEVAPKEPTRTPGPPPTLIVPEIPTATAVISPTVAVKIETPVATATVQPTSEPTPGGEVKSKDMGVNIRAGDGTNFDIIGGLNPGEKFTVIERTAANGGWYKIRLRNGTEGWVSAGLVDVNAQALALAKAEPDKLPATPVPATKAAPPPTAKPNPAPQPTQAPVSPEGDMDAYNHCPGGCDQAALAEALKYPYEIRDPALYQRIYGPNLEKAHALVGNRYDNAISFGNETQKARIAYVEVIQPYKLGSDDSLGGYYLNLRVSLGGEKIGSVALALDYSALNEKGKDYFKNYLRQDQCGVFHILGPDGKTDFHISGGPINPKYLTPGKVIGLWLTEAAWQELQNGKKVPAGAIGVFE